MQLPEESEPMISASTPDRFRAAEIHSTRFFWRPLSAAITSPWISMLVWKEPGNPQVANKLLKINWRTRRESNPHPPAQKAHYADTPSSTLVSLSLSRPVLATVSATVLSGRRPRSRVYLLCGMCTSGPTCFAVQLHGIASRETMDLPSIVFEF